MFYPSPGLSHKGRGVRGRVDKTYFYFGQGRRKGRHAFYEKKRIWETRLRLWYNLDKQGQEIKTLEDIDIARKAVDAAGEKQGMNIVLLDVSGLCGFADYFVICEGESVRQLDAINDEIEKSLKKEGVTPLHREGGSDSGWLLLDYGNVIIHVFGAEERKLYDLDGFWREAKTVLSIQ